MGLNFSNQLSESITKGVSENTSSFVQDISTTNSQNMELKQSVKLVIEGQLNGCTNLAVTLEGAVTGRSLSTVTVEQITTLQAKIEDEFQTAATAAIEQTNQELNILQTNVANQVNRVITETKSVNKSTIEQVISDTITQNANIDQVIEITIGKDAVVNVEGSCEFGTKAVIDLLSESIVDSMMKNYAETDIGKSIIHELDSATTQTNKGINLTVILIIVAVLAGIGLVVYFVVKAKQNKKKEQQSQQMGNTAPSTVQK